MFDVFYFTKKPNLFPHERRVDSIEQAKKLSTTRYFWVVNYLSDYSEFDFLWEPVPWESKYRHVWRSQWQEHSGTELVPRDWDGVDTKYHEEKIERDKSVPIYIIDHGNNRTPKTSSTASVVRTVRYANSYLETLRRIVNSSTEEHVWVISTLCNYDYFTWTWHPSEWQMDMIHVFPSNEQKFGDTFYIHVPTAKRVLKEVKMLDWANLNFVSHMPVIRHKMPLIEHNADSHVQVLNMLDPHEPFTVLSYVDEPNKDYVFSEFPTISVWDAVKKTVVSLMPGSSTIVVPKEVVQYVKQEMYDYPYIIKTRRYTEPRLPIVFLSNNEDCADENWHDLCEKFSQHQPIRVHGVKGRVASQHAAAEAANSSWYFLVPAKIKIHKDFDFNWQPDRLQRPKHYIFNTLNPVTGLSYGHMGMICYCRSLVMNTMGNGLDFTLESAHEVTGIEAGVASLENDPHTAWRTAFREVVKLQHYQKIKPSIETKYRLETWLTVGNEYTLSGADYAQRFYDNVNGDFDQLKKTYDWAWIEDQYSDVLSQL